MCIKREPEGTSGVYAATHEIPRSAYCTAQKLRPTDSRLGTMM